MRRVEEIAEALRNEIQSGKTAVNSVLPTEIALQRQFLAGRSTIRRALDELVASGWAARVPNRGVQARLGSHGPQSSLIAFIDHADDIHKTLFFSLGQMLAESGLHVVHIDSTHRRTMGALEYALEGGFAAAVFWGKEMLMDPVRLAAVQAKLPVIAVDHCPNNAKVDVVRGDHFGGAKAAVGHLLDMGRERVAVSGYLTLLDDTRQRMLGYADAHHQRNKSFPVRNFLFSSSVSDLYDKPHLLGLRLQEQDRPDAVFVLHDLSAPAVAACVLDAGLRLPEDVAIVGFGNDLPFTIGECGLTTVAMDWAAIAGAIRDRILDRLNHPRLSLEDIVVPARLVVRGSCGAPKSEWRDQEYQVSSATLSRRLSPDVWRKEFGTSVKPLIPSSLSLKSSSGSSPAGGMFRAPESSSKSSRRRAPIVST